MSVGAERWNGTFLFLVVRNIYIRVAGCIGRILMRDNFSVVLEMTRVLLQFFL